jgi:uncharacterized protein
MKLKNQREYEIEFRGLKDGVHNFEYQITNEFLKFNPSDELEEIEAAVLLQFEKQSRMLILDFDISGSAKVLCDRCLDPLVYPVDGHERLIIKFGDESYEETDEVVVLPATEHRLDLSQYIYEYLHLLLPIQRVHGTDAEGNSLCDPDMLRRIVSDEPETDPENSPWGILKDLKNDISNS